MTPEEVLLILDKLDLILLDDSIHLLINDLILVLDRLYRLLFLFVVYQIGAHLIAYIGPFRKRGNE